MTSLDLLYFSLAIGFLTLVGFVSYAAYNLSRTLKELTSILEKIDDITKDVDELKNHIKNGILYLKNMLVRKGGDKNGK
ncbi:MAG: DUF948 domain-containing protein [Candidatus Woesebacteria bacterium]|nr:DUF948 domain-containing protein [Candidatus Woesebacteria bacterium]